MIEHCNDIDSLFYEIVLLMKNGDYVTAYSKLDNPQLADDPKAIASKAFLNYCGYVQFESKDKSLTTLQNLSATSNDATYFLASAYLIPGIFESIKTAIPHSMQLLEGLYKQKYTRCFMLYSNLLVQNGEYNRAWEILRESETIPTTPVSDILQQKTAIIMHSPEMADQLPAIFEECVNQYNNGNYSVCSLYAGLLLNKNGQFCDISLGLKVLEEGVTHNDLGCLKIKSRLLVSFDGLIKRDPNLAVDILKGIIEKNVHDQEARLILSQIYLIDDQYKNSGYEKEVVKLLSDSYWYCNLDAINFYLGTIKKYNLFECFA